MEQEIGRLVERRQLPMTIKTASTIHTLQGVTTDPGLIFVCIIPTLYVLPIDDKKEVAPPTVDLDGISTPPTPPMNLGFRVYDP